VDRPSKARRRFNTDRIVDARRARYRNETPWYGRPSDARLAYGSLANTDPWDCGQAACGICLPRQFGRRRREGIRWRAEWDS
jgi:hypothetical protein